MRQFFMKSRLSLPFTGLALIALVALTGLVLSPHPAPAQGSNTLPASFADLADELLPAVVNISSTQSELPRDRDEGLEALPQFPPGSPFEDFFEEFLDRRDDIYPQVPPTSLGSGFIIDAENKYIVTNNHVVRDADKVQVTFHDDTTLEAEVIGRDEKLDLAVLQVDTDKSLRAVSFGDSEVLRVGDWVLAIGNPFGLGGTVTAGIVSAQQRNINAGPYDDFIQTDASINRGNSGGPMFNLDGEVIGINTAIFSPSGGSVGIGFAIPAHLAQPVINQLITYGRTRRGWLGVRIQTVTDEIAESLGMEEAKGALVASITPDGPADEAGLEAGDIILRFNNEPVDEMRQLPRLVAETNVSSEVSVTYLRDGQTQETRVTLGELEKAEEEGLLSEEEGAKGPTRDNEMEMEKLGLTVTPLSEGLREDMRLDSSVDGVMISDVSRGSEAAAKGLVPGDVIVEVNQKDVKTPQDLQVQVEEAVSAGRKSVLLLVNREGTVRFVALKLPQDDEAKEE